MRRRSLLVVVLVALAIVVTAVATRSGGSGVLREWINSFHGVAGH